MLKYKIADVNIELRAPLWTLHENLKAFENNTIMTRDLCCEIAFEKRVYMPMEQDILLAGTSCETIFKRDGCIHIFFGDESDIPSYLIISDDLSVCWMYIHPQYDAPEDEILTKCVREGILAALKKVMIMVLSVRDGLLIHSSTIVCNSVGIAFSAPSGTGKTTHTSMWERLYGVDILDGDVAAIRIINGIVCVYGLPWCGTSGKFINASVPLGGIVFLQQAKKNYLQRLGFQESCLRIISRSFLHPYDENMMDRYLDAAQKIAAGTECYLLDCLPDEDAAELVKERLHMVLKS